MAPYRYVRGRWDNVDANVVKNTSIDGSRTS